MKLGRIVGTVVATRNDPSLASLEARLTAVTKDRPVDAVIMGIVDCFDVEGRSVSLA